MDIPISYKILVKNCYTSKLYTSKKNYISTAYAYRQKGTFRGLKCRKPRQNAIRKILSTKNFFNVFLDNQ